MTITADTTDEQILAQVRRALEGLSKASEYGDHQVVGTNYSEELASFLITVAEAEGNANAEWIYRGALIAGQDPKAVAFNHLVNPVNDTWSGRKNDIRRAKHDAFVRRLGDLARFGA